MSAPLKSPRVRALRSGYKLPQIFVGRFDWCDERADKNKLSAVLFESIEQLDEATIYPSISNLLNVKVRRCGHGAFPCQAPRHAEHIKLILRQIFGVRKRFFAFTEKFCTLETSQKRNAQRFGVLRGHLPPFSGVRSGFYPRPLAALRAVHISANQRAQKII